MWYISDPLWWVDFQTDNWLITRLTGVNTPQRIDKPRPSVGFRGGDQRTTDAL